MTPRRPLPREKDAVTKLASDEFCKIYLGETLVNDGTMYANPNSDGTAYSVSYAMDKVNVGWYRLDASSGAWVGTLAVKNENGVATFSNADFKKLSGGETIIFAQDIELADEIQSNRADLTDITFDLGGNKITIPKTITDGFDLSLYKGGYQRLALTWQNGTIDCFIRQPFYGYGGATSVFTFDNVTLNYEDTGIILDCYFGTWIVKNSTINAPNGTAIAFQKADGYQNVQIENSTVNAKIPIRMYIHGSTALDSDNFYIKNSTVNATSYVIWALEGASHTSASYFELGIEGCKINAPAIMNVSSAVVGKVSVIMSDTYFVNNPVLQVDSSNRENTDLYKVAAKTGEKIMGIEGVEGYSYYAGKITVNSGDFQANLTLHSDFNLNFHANKDTILAVYYNGTALELVDYNGKAVYSIKDIRPDTAAETLEFVVWVKQGDVTYKVPLTYSVLKYAEAVVGDGTVVNTGTKLVSAVMNYVKAAYEYVGKTAPEFEGVTYTAPTVTTPDAFSHSAIKGVQLSLDTEIGVRFNLNSAYTGTLTVDGATYQIVNGKLDGTEVGYVVANVRAYEFADKGIEVSDASDSAVYTLAHYVSYAKSEGGALETLIGALYEYSYYANDYKNN